MEKGDKVIVLANITGKTLIPGTIHTVRKAERGCVWLEYTNTTKTTRPIESWMNWGEDEFFVISSNKNTIKKRNIIEMLAHAYNQGLIKSQFDPEFFLYKALKKYK